MQEILQMVTLQWTRVKWSCSAFWRSKQQILKQASDRLCARDLDYWVTSSSDLETQKQTSKRVRNENKQATSMTVLNLRLLVGFAMSQVPSLIESISKDKRNTEYSGTSYTHLLLHCIKINIFSILHALNQGWYNFWNRFDLRLQNSAFEACRRVIDSMHSLSDKNRLSKDTTKHVYCYYSQPIWHWHYYHNLEQIWIVMANWAETHLSFQHVSQLETSHYTCLTRSRFNIPFWTLSLQYCCTYVLRTLKCVLQIHCISSESAPISNDGFQSAAGTGFLQLFLYIHLQLEKSQQVSNTTVKLYFASICDLQDLCKCREI